MKASFIKKTGSASVPPVGGAEVTPGHGPDLTGGQGDAMDVDDLTGGQGDAMDVDDAAPKPDGPNVKVNNKTDPPPVKMSDMEVDKPQDPAPLVKKKPRMWPKLRHSIFVLASGRWDDLSLNGFNSAYNGKEVSLPPLDMRPSIPLTTPIPLYSFMTA